MDKMEWLDKLLKKDGEERKQREESKKENYKKIIEEGREVTKTQQEKLKSTIYPLLKKSKDTLIHYKFNSEIKEIPGTLADSGDSILAELKLVVGKKNQLSVIPNAFKKSYTIKYITEKNSEKMCQLSIDNNLSENFQNTLKNFFTDMLESQ